MAHLLGPSIDDDPIRVYWSDDDMSYVAKSSDFPECVGKGRNQMDALRALRESVAELLKGRLN